MHWIVSFILLITYFGKITLYAQNLSYIHQYTLASHNSYEKKYAQNFEEVLENVQAIEIDIWDSKSLLHTKGLIRDWYVRHSPFKKGNVNNLNGTFKDYLMFLREWSEQNPHHPVITVFVDKKQNWKKFRTPRDFDSLIVSIFSEKQLFTPKHLINTQFPNIDSLKGKFIFVITDATLFNPKKPLNEYLEKQNSHAIAFVAPAIKKESDVLNPPKISKENNIHIKFFNLHYKHHKILSKIKTINGISRVYKCPENQDIIEILIQSKTNFIAVNNFRLEIKKLHRR